MKLNSRVTQTKLFKMKVKSIKGTLRTIAEHSSDQNRSLKALRKAGQVPCVIYGQKDPVHFTVESRDLDKLIYTPEIFQVTLELDGKKIDCIIKELQFHPVKDNAIHVDFFEVNEATPIVIKVPVKLNGLAAGVRTGGKLVLQMRKISVKALIGDIPERLDIDVTNLALGKTIKVGDLNFGDKTELVSAKKAVVCAVKLTRAAQGAAETATVAAPDAAAE